MLSLFTSPSWARSRVEELVDLMSLEQLMTLEASSTSFFDTPVEKTPGSLYIIPEEILDFSYAASLADYLSYYVPGVHISEFYNKGPLYSTRGISGGANSTTLFMLDSEILNSSSGMPSNLNLPLLGYAERLEVLNGPCSLIHGSGAVNGFVNIIHKNGKDNPGAFVSIESGLENRQTRMETGYGVSDNRLGDLYLYAGAVEAASLDTPARAPDAFHGPSFRTSLNWRKDKFTLTAFADREKFESGLTQPFTDIEDGYPDVEMDTYALMPAFRSEITDKEDITVSLPLKYIKQSLSSADDEESNINKELQFQSKVIFRSTRISYNRIAAGGSATLYKSKSEIRRYEMPGSPQDDGGTTVNDLSLDLSWVALSAFMEDTIELTSSLTLISGIRFDSVHAKDFKKGVDGAEEEDVSIKGDYDEVLTPRIGLTYELDQAGILKFMYQQGYNYPDYSSLLSGDNHKDISTEKIQSFELGYHRSFDASKAQFNLNAYYNIFKDTAFQDKDGDSSDDSTPSSLSVDRFDAIGFEATLAFHPFNYMRVDASYAYSRPFNLDGDSLVGTLVNDEENRWIIYPEHVVKLNLSKSFLDDRLEITIGCLFNSSVSTITEGSRAEGEGLDDVFDHNRFVVNAAARYLLSERLNLTLRANNILNNDVPATGYYYYWGYSEKNSSFTRPQVYAALEWIF